MREADREPGVRQSMTAGWWPGSLPRRVGWRLVEKSTPILRLTYQRPKFVPLMVDSSAWVIGLTIGAILKLTDSVAVAGRELLILASVAVVAQALIGRTVGMYRYRWRISSFEEVLALGITWLTVAAGIMIGNFLLRPTPSDLPTSAVITGTLAAMGLMVGARVFWRRWWEYHRRPDVTRSRRTVVFGAGEGGALVVRAMLSDPNSEYYPVALLDDAEILAERQLDGVSVEGTRDDLIEVANRHGATVLLIALPSADSQLIKELSDLAVRAGLEVRVLPATNELVGKMSVADVRQPTVEDILGRAPVEIDLASVADYLRGRRILITGAGGSIGSELSRQVRGFDPGRLYLLDRDETALHGLQLSMEGRALLDTDELVVADIRDRERIFEIFAETKPEVVFHAAALKHLTLLENHPAEGIKTNVLGTKNLLDAAMAHQVSRFVNVSTDKAADPTSVLGATKLAAERLTARAAGTTSAPYLSVRFGNVLGSRGSVLPTFIRQLEDGNPITVTHPDVTRYFMTIPEAARLVVQAGAIGDPGEVLILDMGEPVKIVDLANQLIEMLRPGAKIEFTGLRPGEKLDEVLIADKERAAVKVHPRIMHASADAGDPAKALEIMGAETVEQARTLISGDDPLSLIDLTTESSVS